MKQYILIKEYDNSPDKGAIVKQDKKVYNMPRMYSAFSGEFPYVLSFNSDEIENNANWIEHYPK